MHTYLFNLLHLISQSIKWTMRVEFWTSVAVYQQIHQTKKTTNDDEL